MSRYRLIPRQVTVPREGRKPLSHWEIGERSSSFDRTLALANPEETDREYRCAVHVGDETGGEWVLVYLDRPDRPDSACEIACDFALDRWPGYKVEPSAEEIESEAFTIAGRWDGVAREITDEMRWEAHDHLTEGCFGVNGGAEYCQVNQIVDLTDREALIDFLYPSGIDTPITSTIPDDSIVDRWLQGPAKPRSALAR